MNGRQYLHITHSFAIQYRTKIITWNVEIIERKAFTDCFGGPENAVTDFFFS